jgi:hypothetical protein
MQFIPIVKIVRLEESEIGTFGSLLIQGMLFCTTLEPYNDKQIGTGMYAALRFHSPKFGKDTFKLVDTLGRKDIEFHPGNWIGDTDGCILLGQDPIKLSGQRGIPNSGNTFDAFMKELEGYNTITVIVKEEY